MEDQPDEPVTIEVRDLARVHLNPGDVLVVRLPIRPSASLVQRLTAEMRPVFPDNRVLVLDKDTDLTVVTTETQA